MPTLEPLPISSAFAVPEERIERFPKLIAGEDWIRTLGRHRIELQKASRNQGSVVLTGQGAAIATSPVPLESVPPGLYQVAVYARITRAASSSSSLTVTISWTDGSVAMSLSLPAITGNTVSDFESVVRPIRVDSGGPISYSTAYSSTGATSMQYRLTVAVQEVALEAT